ncbi:MAG: dimethyl sulfoxide reductase anchor subunit [Planctomycetaceae bacterium]|nr:dimethyl sulfoxide reductase anchor subunit [Planctomycetaceae bacterium]
MSLLDTQLPIVNNPDQPGTGRIAGRESGQLQGGGLLQYLLNEQQQLTAVEEFSQFHDAQSAPAQARYYEKLLPASPPQAGEQYAFEVDLDCCSGCKACVTACHSLNGLDDGETWRDVGLLLGGTTVNPVMQHVTTACHHCLEPPCMIACPVDAYEKHPETGIVRHLDDQCFGCQYCTLACPYDVPKYHSGKGIVRKCDMCTDRLAAGEAPACVQACPHEAIAIRVVKVSEIRENAEADLFLPGAPEPHISFPTTNYRTARVFPRNTLPADYHAVSPQHPHWPLIIMLVLTQLSVGAFLCGFALEVFLPASLPGAFTTFQATSALIFGLLALGASTLHLGRPQYAFRGIIGLRHSWLSREILAFGLFAGAACLYAGSTWSGWSPEWLGRGLEWAVALFGILGVFCSAMIYDFTQREFWSFSRSMSKFALTAGLLGISATWLTLLAMRHSGADVGTDAELLSLGSRLSLGLLTVGSVKLVYELSLLTHLLDHRMTPLRRSAKLLVGPLSSISMARFAAGVLGGVILPLLLLTSLAAGTREQGELPVTIAVSMSFLACLVGELLERYLFFAAVAAPRMPGGPRT